MTDDLVAFLREKLAATERIARQVTVHDGDGEPLWVLDDDYKHDTLVVEASWVLADVEAKRAIVDRCATLLREHDLDCFDGTTLAGDVLRALAGAYRDRDGWQEAWQ